jgi:ribonuclease III
LGILEVAVRDPLRPLAQGDQLTIASEVAPPGDPALLPRAQTLVDFQRIIGHAFTAPALLTEALTHPSAILPERGRGRRAKPPNRGYERLEFLGDRVLGLVVADLLWRRFEAEPEGLLTRRHTHLVRRETLARVAETIGLRHHLILSRAEAAAGGSANPAILADACEAIIAAIYLDGGFNAAAAFVRRFWEPLIGAMEGPPCDPKTALQEWAQARGLGLPRYELVATSGPDHAPLFTVAASIAGGETANATASAKRIAEAGAAAALLGRIANETGKTG